MTLHCEHESDRNRNRETEYFSAIVRSILLDDIQKILPILETWVRDSETGEIDRDEIENIQDTMRQNVLEPTIAKSKYFVAVSDNDEIIGMIGCKIPEEEMTQFTTTSKPLELINAFVGKDHRGGKGVGKTLVGHIEEFARLNGFTEIILNSGPRYKDTAWGFYDKAGFKRIGIAENFYGESIHAPVWQKQL